MPHLDLLEARVVSGSDHSLQSSAFFFFFLKRESLRGTKVQVLTTIGNVSLEQVVRAPSDGLTCKYNSWALNQSS